MYNKFGKNYSNSSYRGGGGSSSSSYGGRGKGRGGYNSSSSSSFAQSSSSSSSESYSAARNALQAAARIRQRDADQAFDERSGYSRIVSSEIGTTPRIGYLFNMLPCSLVGEDQLERSALDLYLLQQDGSTFKATIAFEPYFYIVMASHTSEREREVVSVLERKFEGLVSSAPINGERGVSIVEREDLEMPNHLAGHKRRLVKMRFRAQTDLMKVRRELTKTIESNLVLVNRGVNLEEEAADTGDVLRLLCELREHDVAYYTRAAIDLDVRCGAWYSVIPAHIRIEGGLPNCSDVSRLPESFEGVTAPKVLAWDIECTKAPLKFPDAKIDQVYMISYMLDGQGYLIINREIVSTDVPDFEYSPSEEFHGPFLVTNCPNEEAMIRHFITHCKEVRPQVYVTYNGDYFDWPFMDKRSAEYGISLKAELGMSTADADNAALMSAGGFSTASSSSAAATEATTKTASGSGSDEWRGRTAVHLDCFYWVKRDSYLPQGSHGLKAVTREKLGYDPVEIDPEDMLSMARDEPLHMANYSVSDAVATYYLYMKYIRAFVFSLSTIIPMGPDDVLRKGSGTLCEMLLMVEAFKKNILCPNKQRDALGKTYQGHLLDSETYEGGHVECLESGVFRNDVPCVWRLVPQAFDGLISGMDAALTFAIEVENGIQRADIVDYDEVRASIIERLELLRDKPLREETPVIYHLDVAAMYPNIILSNRLQPQAIVTPEQCSRCDFDTLADARCKRQMEWKWRGEYIPASAEEVTHIRNQLENETVDGILFSDLDLLKRETLVKARLKDYSQVQYKSMKATAERDMSATVCQRENPFYVDTVRAFRDRRYDYKLMTKKANKELDAAEKRGNPLEIEIARNKAVLYDSLQLAHKCILNSFYGYVMRKGARWHSMEMAGVVTLTGSKLITQARKLVEQVGRPLELDTDGIWCILPSSFPQRYDFKTKSGKKIEINYPCIMLNADVHEGFTNHQYQELDPTTGVYKIRSECSIFFELDGPYKAMVLPASPEEGVLLKKRYAVYGLDGELKELKGFELKRRGELKMIKNFQKEVFDAFLDGTSLQGCYAAVGAIANNWLNMLDTQGEDLPVEEIIELLSENRSMSKTVEEYGDQKSVALSTAKRLGEFLGADTIKGKGLACKLLVSKFPSGAPVSERAIPTTIFSAHESVRRHFLRRWSKDSSLSDAEMGIRSLLDWSYYRTRLEGCVRKIITIPAALQGVLNPVKGVSHPDWLMKALANKSSTHRQLSISGFLVSDTSSKLSSSLLSSSSSSLKVTATTSGSKASAGDIEDIGRSSIAKKFFGKATKVTKIVEDKNDVEKDNNKDSDTDMVLIDEGKDSLVPQQPIVPIEPVIVPPFKSDSTPDEFAAWLLNRKIQWRKARKANAFTGIGSRTMTQAPTSSSSSSLRSSLSSSSLSSSSSSFSSAPGFGYLQVIDIKPDPNGQLGDFIVWAFTSPRRVQALHMTAKRSVYINRRAPLPFDHPLIKESAVNGAQAIPAGHKRLPHDAVPHFLYEINIPEIKFQKRVRQFERGFDDPDIVGVYETSTPQLFNLLLTLSCVNEITTQGFANAIARAEGTFKGGREEAQAITRRTFGPVSLGGSGLGLDGKLHFGTSISSTTKRAKTTGKSAIAPFVRQPAQKQQQLTLFGTMLKTKTSASAIPSSSSSSPSLGSTTLNSSSSSSSSSSNNVNVIEGEDGVLTTLETPSRIASSNLTTSQDIANVINRGETLYEEINDNKAMITTTTMTTSDDNNVMSYIPSNTEDTAVMSLMAAELNLSQLGNTMPFEEIATDHELDISMTTKSVRFASPEHISTSILQKSEVKDETNVPSPSILSKSRTILSPSTPEISISTSSSLSPSRITATHISSSPDVMTSSSSPEVIIDTVQTTSASASKPISKRKTIKQNLTKTALLQFGEESGRASEPGTLSAYFATTAPSVSSMKSTGLVPTKASLATLMMHPTETAEVNMSRARQEWEKEQRKKSNISGSKHSRSKSNNEGIYSSSYSSSSSSSSSFFPSLRISSSSLSSSESNIGLSSLRLEASDLNRLINPETHPYLNPTPLDIEGSSYSAHGASSPSLTGSAWYRRAFLYHSHSTKAPYGLTALFIIQKTDSEYAWICANEMLKSLKSTGEISNHLPLDDTRRRQLRTQASLSRPGYEVPFSIEVHLFVSAPGASANNAKKPGHQTTLGASGGTTGDRLSRTSVIKQFAETNETFTGHTENALSNIKIKHVDSQEQAWRALGGVLEDLSPASSTRNPPLIVMSCAPISSTGLAQLIPSTASFPLLQIDFNKAEMDYPSLSWADVACAHAYINFFKSLQWWKERLQLANYMQVPIGNIDDIHRGFVGSGVSQSKNLFEILEKSSTLTEAPTRDVFIGIADLSFARTLSNQNHLLWLDFGAVEPVQPEPLQLILASPSINVHQHHNQSSLSASAVSMSTLKGTRSTTNGGEALTNPQVISSGVYRGVSVCIKVSMLAVNALLSSTFLPGAVDGTNGDDLATIAAAAEEDIAASAAKYASSASAASLASAQSASSGKLRRVAASGSGNCLHAFRSLRKLVSLWADDWKRSRSPIAMCLLERFYAWVAAPTSLLHDPALHKMLHSLMLRVFEALVKELKKSGHGLTVVFASFDKLILATPRTSAAPALSLVRNALDRVSALPLFKYLDFKPSQLYASLCFLDQVNYCAVTRSGEAAQVEEQLLHLASRSLPEESSAMSRSTTDLNTSSNGTVAMSFSALLSSSSGGDLDDEFVSMFIRSARDAAEETGLPMSKEKWGKLKREYLQRSISDLSVQPKWAIADYLPSTAVQAFQAAAEAFLLKPLRWRATRAFSKLRRNFESKVESSVIEAIMKRSGPALALLKSTETNDQIQINDDNDNNNEEKELAVIQSVKKRTRDEADEGEAELSSDDDFSPKPTSSTISFSKTPLSTRPITNQIDNEDNTSPSSSSSLSNTLLSQQRNSSATKLDMATVRTLVKSSSREDEENEVAAAKAYVQELVRDELHNKMIKAVKILRDASHQHDFSAVSAPLLAAHAGADRSNIALEFVKVTCHMLSLDFDCQNEILSIRATLLALLHVRESEAMWSDPGLSYTLSDVVCRNCHSCSDLDLCRDKVSFEEEEERIEDESYIDEDGNEIARPVSRFYLHTLFSWLCSHCNSPFDRDDLELRLISAVHRRSAAHQSQDLKCATCHRVRSGALQKVCSCSGKFVPIESKSEFERYMRVFKCIAVSFEFQDLTECCERLGINA
jgi:DNA polymerase elongation subunit (family B)